MVDLIPANQNRGTNGERNACYMRFVMFSYIYNLFTE